MKVAINKCFGGFNLSGKAMKRYLELKGKPCYFYKQTKYAWRDGKNEYSKVSIPDNEEFLDIVATKDFGESISKWPENDTIFYGDIKRTDPCLIQTIEELGDEASGHFSCVEVVEIPDDIDWEISNYDGIETVE